MKTVSKILIGISVAILAIAVIMGVTTASVIGIKALYQHLNPQTSETADVEDYHIGDEVDDVVGFTNQVASLPKT